jgi:calcineurin-like phosphoesterase family protein
MPETSGGTMTQKVWVIGDTHFGHALMANTRGFGGDIDLHDRTLVEAWNATVRPDDTIWHVGDVFFRDGWRWLSSLLGNKRVCLGNHDAKKADVLRQCGFELFGMCEVRGVLLSHMPVHETQLRRFRLNVHGHTHTARINDPRYVPVSVEHLTDWKPILLQTAIQQGVPSESRTAGA